MKILIAPNAFKGTLTAKQAAAAIARGLHRALPAAELIQCPVADGGDGFAAVLAHHLGAQWIRRRVHDPSGKKVTATFAFSKPRATAIIELARASGLALLQRREPMRASTRGTGELIAAAVKLGARRILIGIGGSASTDGGTGLARALGGRFLDAKGEELREGGGALIDLARIDLEGIRGLKGGVRVQVACDVNSPLFGPRGAAHIFAPQKGASPAQVRRLDAGLRRLGQVIRRDLGMNVQGLSGSGAAGGAGAGLAAFCGGELVGGFELVARTIGLAKRLQGCDLVVTGEGKLDRTTQHQKAPAGVMRMAQKAGIPVVAICGRVEAGVERIGFDAVFEAIQGGEESSPGECLARGAVRMGDWIQENLVTRERERGASPRR